MDARINIYFAEHSSDLLAKHNTAAAPVPGHWAPGGPGWYLYVSQTDPPGEIIRVKLTPKQVEQIATVLDKMADGRPVFPKGTASAPQIGGTIKEAIQATSKHGKTVIERKLEEAEAAAQRIAELRNQISEFE